MEKVRGKGLPNSSCKGTEAMRRIWVLLASVGTLSMTLGCHHTAGVCDCEAPCNPCWVGQHHAAPPPVVTSAVPAPTDPGSESLRVMPRVPEPTR